MKIQKESDVWIPIFIAWSAFTKTQAHLGLSGSLAAMRRFLSLHADALEAHGAIVKANNRHWLANVNTFDECAFRAAIGKLAKVAA